MAEYLFVLIVFLANVVEGITGFAGTMLAMPAAMLLVGVDEAKIILNMFITSRSGLTSAVTNPIRRSRSMAVSSNGLWGR